MSQTAASISDYLPEIATMNLQIKKPSFDEVIDVMRSILLFMLILAVLSLMGVVFFAAH